jgi:hypothetical protein
MAAFLKHQKRPIYHGQKSEFSEILNDIYAIGLLFNTNYTMLRRFLLIRDVVV